MSSPTGGETIAELFARSGKDPESLSADDLDRLIDFYRDNRKNFKTAGVAAPKADKPKPSLDELGL
jgi:hypothetical protein